MLSILLVAGCGPPPPTAEDIRQAYADHVRRDPVHERGLQAKEAPMAIPQQRPSCTRDGRTHFDCRIRVIFETQAGRESQEQQIHIRRERDSWVIDSIN